MQSVCHCCDWIRHHYGHLSKEYLSLLDQMGGDITEQDALVFSPKLLYRRMENAKFEDKVRFRNDTIYQITKLFDGNMKAVTWDKKKLDHFLNILERQFENLNSCNYSAHAWELIRKETKRHLLKLEILATQMY